jgi:prevent-host-death family protein
MQGLEVNMDTVPQIVPISDMKLHQAQVIGMLEDGPVVLSQRGRPKAVLVSVEEWDRRARRLKELELLSLARARLAEMDRDPSMIVTQDELDRLTDAEDPAS